MLATGRPTLIFPSCCNSQIVNDNKVDDVLKGIFEKEASEAITNGANLAKVEVLAKEKVNDYIPNSS